MHNRSSDEAFAGVQVVLPRFVDDPEVASALCFHVCQRDVNFQPLQGNLIAHSTPRGLREQRNPTFTRSKMRWKKDPQRALHFWILMRQFLQ